jgi:biofilm PGA synthesis N-glycosyltransferase PgaC
LFALEFAIVGLVVIAFPVAVYLTYFFVVLRRRDESARFQSALSDIQISSAELAPVSVIVNTFNEAKIIARKLTNISKLNYPLSRLEVIVIDDDSVDGTADIAEAKMSELKLSGKVLRNEKRIGLNRSLNVAMTEAKNDVVCVTDSDVMLEKNALRNSVSVLTHFEGVGGVTGKVQPVFEGDGLAQSSESAYRNFYDNSMLGEASLHSAFPGNGPLIVFNKALVPPTIPVDYGSTDGNIAMNVIKSGARFVYVSNAVIFEPIAENFSQQRLQKVRRAQRLIQVFLHNRDVFLNKKYGKFGRIVFPLKFLMLSICPFLMFFGLGLLTASIVLSSNLLFELLFVIGVLFVIDISFFWKRFGRFFSSFVFHEIYLVAGLFTSLRKSVYWKTIERKKFTVHIEK